MNGKPTSWWLGIAIGERITNVTLDAGTKRRVVDDAALGIQATGAGAWIATLLIDAGELTGTLRVDGTFRAAVGRLTYEGGQAGAGRHAIDIATLRVGATWCGHAGITQWFTLHLNGWCYGEGEIRVKLQLIDYGSRHPMLTWYGVALSKGIASEATNATTAGTVVANTTHGIATACVGATRIDALLIDACLVYVTLRRDCALRTTGRRLPNELR